MMVFFAAAVVLAGCHGDPNVRKQKYLESGQRYSAEGKYREAAIQFSNALKIDKGYADAHYALAQTYVHLGQFSGAYAELARTVELQPTNYKARIDLGNLLIAAGKIDEAQAQADAVLAAATKQPGRSRHALRHCSQAGPEGSGPDPRFSMPCRSIPIERPSTKISRLLQSGDPSQTASVEDELKKAVALDPKSVNAKLFLAEFYAKNSRWSDAEKTGWDAVATDPKSLAARENVANIILKEGDRARAEEVLRQASKDLASDPRGVRILADYYAGSGQMDKAKAEFSSLAAKYPKNISVKKGYIRVLLETKDYGTAQTVVEGLMKTDGKDPEVAGLNGIVLLNSGKAGDAVNALQNAVRDSPKDAFLQYWLGRAALASGNINLAESSLRQAETLNPSALQAEVELARIASQRGDMNLLADVAGKTIAAAPRLPEGYVWRAMVEISHNATDKAEADLNTAISIAPKSPQAYLQLGKLRFAQKRFPEGVKLLEEALQYDPNSFESLRLLVSYDLYQKQPEKALARLNAQIEKSPNNSSFYDLLAQFQIQQKKLDDAAATAQKAIQLNSGDGEAVLAVRANRSSARTDGERHRRLGAVVRCASKRCRGLGNSGNS